MQVTKFPVDQKYFDATFKQFLNSAEGYKAIASREIGWIRGKMIFFKFTFLSGMNRGDPTQTVKKPAFDKFDGFVKNQKKTAPDGLKTFAQTTGVWPWMPTEEAFVNNARNGIIISIAFAFLILLIATRNVLQSLIAIMSVIMIVISVVASMHWNEMQLGVSESIAIVILIGFSVDYVVHFSHAYIHSEYESRNDKMKQSYREMGVSILSGCITTFGCGAFLFGGTISFFYKFAFIIAVTVLTSIVVAVFTFGAACHAFGPQ